MNMNILVPIRILFNVLCQSSVLAYFANTTTRFSVNTLYNRLSVSPEFIQFINTNADKDGKTITRNFIKNMIYKTFDESSYAKFIVDNQELDKVFQNENLSQDDKIKVFLGRTLIKIIGDEDNELANDNDFRTFLNGAVNQFLDQLGDCSSINSSRDFYHHIVDLYTSHLMDNYYKEIDLLKLGDSEIEDIEPIYDSCASMIDSFNNTISYSSKYSGKKRKRDDNDDKRDPKRPKK